MGVHAPQAFNCLVSNASVSGSLSVQAFSDDFFFFSLFGNLLVKTRYMGYFFQGFLRVTTRLDKS